MTTSTTSVIAAARCIELDSAMLPGLAKLALTKAHEQTGGYPASASGANPGAGSASSDDPATSVERAAFSPDQAAADIERLGELILRAQRDLRSARAIVDRYVDRRLDSTARALAEARAADLEANWCRNCQTHGHLAPRHGRASLCSWCEAFKADQGYLPGKSLVDQRAQGRRITEADIARARGRRGKAA